MASISETKNLQIVKIRHWVLRKKGANFFKNWIFVQEVILRNYPNYSKVNRYRRKAWKVDASIFDSAVSHTRRSDASEKREENSVVALRSLLNVFSSGQVSSPRLYRLRSKCLVEMSLISETKNVQNKAFLTRYYIWNNHYNKTY